LGAEGLDTTPLCLCYDISVYKKRNNTLASKILQAERICRYSSYQGLPAHLGDKLKVNSFELWANIVSSPGYFDEIHNFLIQLLCKQSLERFMKSDLFEDFVRLERRKERLHFVDL
jgi:hypothetical protein